MQPASAPKRDVSAFAIGGSGAVKALEECKARPHREETACGVDLEQEASPSATGRCGCEHCNGRNFLNDFFPLGWERDVGLIAFIPMSDGSRPNGLAPIKAEFLVPVASAASTSAAPPASAEVGSKRSAPDDDNHTAEEESSASGVAANRPRQRGMNKHRKPFKPEAVQLKMCSAIVEGRECSFGDGCRYSHDLKACMEARPADLGEECPIYTLRGHCRFGVNCRFGSVHLDPSTGANLHKTIAEVPYEELNITPNDLFQRLRKKAVDFRRVDALAVKYTSAVQDQHEHHNNLQQSNEAKTEAAATDATRGQAESGTPDATTESASATTTSSTDPAAVPEPPVSASTYHALAAVDALPPEHARRPLDFRGKLYLAPLTTVGNLPFRRICKKFGVDITCSEMALGTALLQGSPSEWALLKRHPCEDIYGVQIAGNQAQAMGRVAQLIEENGARLSEPHSARHLMPRASQTPYASPSCPCSSCAEAPLFACAVNVDFVDINMGCPIDSICNKGMGSAMSLRPGRIQSVVRTMSSVLTCPLTVKMRVGYDDNEAQRNAHKLIPKIASWGASAVTLHGRSRQQRYSRAADWGYISQCAGVAAAQPQRLILGGGAGIGGIDETEGSDVEGGNGGLPLVGNGDVFSWEDVYGPKAAGVSACMVARGALVKPWVFTEIKERRHWDISSSERLDILKDFTRFGLEHWGSDELGVSRVRKFLLEWLSFLYRYVPVGLLETLPGRLQDRPPAFVGRNDLETLMASASSEDWVKITEMLLGPVPSGFSFTPKHKANAYTKGPIQAEG